jgi:hypothetical protein
VPLKYHHTISQQGTFFRTLRSIGVQVDQSVYPQRSALPDRPPLESAAPSGRIDDPEPDMTASEIEWQVVPNYQSAEDGDSEWTLKARDQAALENAQKLVDEAITHAQQMSHVGFLTLSDRSVFPRIVGTKGANVARLRAETGADIHVGKENNTITIIGMSVYGFPLSRLNSVHRHRVYHPVGERSHFKNCIKLGSPSTSSVQLM